MPAYNAENSLGRAVRSALAQTYSAVEVVVVDDGSRDATLAVAEDLAQQDYRVRVVHKANGGVSSARNAGLATVRGEYVCFLDADDELLPDKAAVQVEALRTNPAFGGVYSQSERVIEGEGRVLPPVRGAPPVPLREVLDYCNWFAPMTAMLRRAVVDQVGTFDEELHRGEDYDYWIRCARVTDFIFLPGVVGRYYLHPMQAHRKPELYTRSRQQLLQKHFTHDTVRRRRFLSYLYLSNAKMAKADGRYLECAICLIRYVIQSRENAGFVWRLSKMS